MCECMEFRYNPGILDNERHGYTETMHSGGGDPFDWYFLYTKKFGRFPKAPLPSSSKAIFVKKWRPSGAIGIELKISHISRFSVLWPSGMNHYE